MNDFTQEGRILYADQYEDMMQIARMAAIKCMQVAPQQSQNPAYLHVSVVNALTKYEKRDRTRRDKTDNLLNEPLDAFGNPEGVEPLFQPDIIARDEAKADVAVLLERADLTDSESLAIELKYGFMRGEDFGPLNVRRAAQMVGRSECWMRSRLTAAMVKLQCAAEPDARERKDTRPEKELELVGYRLGV